MAISNYTELQSEVMDWLEDTTLSSKIPTFIQLAEADINRRLMALRMEQEATLTLAANTDTVTLPSDFVSAISAAILLSGVRVELEQTDPFDVKDGSTTIVGIPNRYAIDGTAMNFEVKAGTTYTIYLRYRYELGLAASTTNWLLTDHPDLYLSATLAQAYAYRSAYDKAATWGSRAGDVIADILNSNLAGQKQITAEFDLPSVPSSFDINRG